MNQTIKILLKLGIQIGVGVSTLILHEATLIKLIAFVLVWTLLWVSYDALIGLK